MNVKKILEPPSGINKRYYRFFVFINLGYIISLFVHLLNILLFYLLDVPPMVIHNIISSFIFAAVIIINRRGFFFTALTIGILEYVSHAVFTTYNIGWGSGYPHYLFFLAVTAYLAPAGKKFIKALLVGFTCVVYISIYYYSVLYSPAYSISVNIIHTMNIVNIIVIFSLLGFLSYYYRNAADVAEAALEREFERSENLLHNILPVEIAEILKKTTGTIADRHEQCSVIFADMVGFTELSERITPEKLVQILNGLFSDFDDIVESRGLEKIKTIGDSYMIAAGLPHFRSDHAETAAACAIDMIQATDRYNSSNNLSLKIRVGINSGPVVAGVIGKKKFTYDLWGDTVNLASRMEYHGVPGEIQVSENTYLILKDKYNFTHRGRITVKGKGEIHTYLLKNKM